MAHHGELAGLWGFQANNLVWLGIYNAGVLRLPINPRLSCFNAGEWPHSTYRLDCDVILDVQLDNDVRHGLRPSARGQWIRLFEGGSTPIIRHELLVGSCHCHYSPNGGRQPDCGGRSSIGALSHRKYVALPDQEQCSVVGPPLRADNGTVIENWRQGGVEGVSVGLRQSATSRREAKAAAVARVMLPAIPPRSPPGRFQSRTPAALRRARHPGRTGGSRTPARAPSPLRA